MPKLTPIETRNADGDKPGGKAVLASRYAVVAALGVLGAFLAPSSYADSPVSGVIIHSVSHEYNTPPWDLRAIHVVDGSGLSPDQTTHAQLNVSNPNSWQTATTGGTANIQFDLGGTVDLTRVKVWNLNFYDPYNGRGARVVDVYTSTNATDWTLVLNDSEFPIASGLDGDLGFELDATAWPDARYVQFDILANWGGFDNAGHTGLSEVLFFSPVPEPAAAMLAALALAGLCARRARATLPVG